MARTRGAISILLGVEVCANCKHFYQHYGYDAQHGKIYPLHIGHCSYPRMKDRLSAETCTHFEHGERAAYARQADQINERNRLYG